MTEQGEQAAVAESDDYAVGGKYHPGFVYCLVDDFKRPKLIKIGHSKNVQNRLSQINSGMPIEMHLWWSFEGYREDEMAMHWLLRKFKHPVGKQREWYTASRQCLAKAYFHHTGPMSNGYCEKMKWLKRRKMLNYLRRKNKAQTSYDWLDSYAQRDNIEHYISEIAQRFDRAFYNNPLLIQYIGFDDFTKSFLKNIAFPTTGSTITDKQLIAMMKIAKDFFKGYWQEGPLQTLQLEIRGDYYHMVMLLMRAKYKHLREIVK